MGVYVGVRKYGRKNMVFWRMVADTLDELNAMADKIGLKREWIQGDKYPMYDVTWTKRKLAIENGAEAVMREGEIISVLERNYGKKEE